MPGPSRRVDRETIRDLRRARRRRRLGDIEWFDVAYRVYLFALVGTIAVVVASDAIGGLVPDDLTTERLVGVGPGLAGLAAVVAVGLGLRAGAEGGPISVEAGDARHLVLAPIPRRSWMLAPAVQRIRSVAFGAALPTAVVAQLVARDVDGSRAAWAGAGAVFGGAVGALFVSVAIVAHAAHLARRIAAAGLALLVGWQIASVVATWRRWSDTPVDATETNGSPAALEAGPGDLLGSVLFWGVRQRGVDVIALVAVVAVGLVSLAAVGRLRADALERRAALVAQLRFAATTQDLRTVMLLRRQLRSERPRPAPWISVGLRSAPPPVTRAWASVMRVPASRLVRWIALAAVAGASAAWTLTWTPVAGVVLVLAVFVFGLEAVEPLAQEIDRPGRTDGLPVPRGRLFASLAPTTLVLAIVMSPVGAGAAMVVAPDSIGLVAFAVAPIVAVLGVIGSISSTVGGAAPIAAVQRTDAFGRDRGEVSALAVPEFAGVTQVTSGLVPLVLSAPAVVPVLALRSDVDAASVIVRGALGAALVVAGLLWWIRRRDAWAVATRNFFAGQGLTTGGVS
ncbi:MAG: hypothetical protein AAF945_11495 [Actinomycetota bacterium]